MGLERPKALDLSSRRQKIPLLNLNSRRSLGSPVVAVMQISPFHSLVFGINRLHSDEMPHFCAKNPCSEAIVQLLCNRNYNGLPDGFLGLS